MRIVYLHQYFNTTQMVGGTRSYEMARRLVARGHDVQMVTSRREHLQGRTGWYETDEDGIRVHWLEIPYHNRMSYPERLRAFARFAMAAGERAANLPGDVVFATSTPLTIALPAVYAAKRQRVPMVFEVRDLWPEMPIAVGALKNPAAIAAARWLERFAYANAQRIIALSPGMAEGVRAAGVPGDRIEVIPNSCDRALFETPADAGAALRAAPWLGDRPLVLYAGTLGRINDVSYFARLAAAVALLAPEVRFLVVGDGFEHEKVKAEAARLGVLDRSFFMRPPVPKQEVPSLLAAASVAVSLFGNVREMWANSANKFFDALAAGRPIVINYGGWQADLIRESGCGLALAQDDVATAAAQLVAFLDDEARLRQAAAAARRLARERFDRDRLALQFERVLLEACRPEPLLPRAAHG